MEVNMRYEGSIKNLGAQIEDQWESTWIDPNKPKATPDKSDPRGMSCIVEDWSTRIFPSYDDVISKCHDGNLNNPGCAYLRKGKDGVYECHGLNKMPIIQELDALPKDDTVKRGCDTVLGWKPRFGCRFVGT